MACKKERRDGSGVEMMEQISYMKDVDKSGESRFRHGNQTSSSVWSSIAWHDLRTLSSRVHALLEGTRSLGYYIVSESGSAQTRPAFSPDGVDVRPGLCDEALPFCSARSRVLPISRFLREIFSSWINGPCSVGSHTKLGFNAIPDALTLVVANTLGCLPCLLRT